MPDALCDAAYAGTAGAGFDEAAEAGAAFLDDDGCGAAVVVAFGRRPLLADGLKTVQNGESDRSIAREDGGILEVGRTWSGERAGRSRRREAYGNRVHGMGSMSGGVEGAVAVATSL